MPRKKELKIEKSMSVIPIIDYAKGSCETDSLRGYYVPKTKEFILTDSYGYNIKRSRTKLTQLITAVLDHGSNGDRTHDACYQAIPEYKKAWDAVIKSFKPVFTEGQEVVRVGHNHERSLQQVDYYTVGPVIGWQKTCRRHSKTEEILCHRTFMAVDGDEITGAESEFRDLAYLEDWKIGYKFVVKLKKTLNINKVLGVTILYKGRAYKV